MNKLVVFSAPSGTGKSTIINHLLTQDLHLCFSVSATSRAPRGNERNGVEYFFLTADEFRRRIGNGDFLEYMEVYENHFYGTLKDTVEEILAKGNNVLFDVDVVGAGNIKQHYGNRALTIFVKPPSLDELRRRLESRGTDSTEVIERRLARAGYELSFAPKFDITIVNDNLQQAQLDTLQAVRHFLAN